jgi:hypothetical protein
MLKRLRILFTDINVDETIEILYRIVVEVE